jgi:hypothetical protein
MDGTAIIRLRPPIDPDDESESDGSLHYLQQQKAASFAGVTKNSYSSQGRRPKESPPKVRKKVADPPGMALDRKNSFPMEKDDGPVDYTFKKVVSKGDRLIDGDRNLFRKKIDDSVATAVTARTRDSRSMISARTSKLHLPAEPPGSTIGAPAARSVQFASVEIHEHSYTLDSGGGTMNPETGLVSPPMTLSWDAQSVSLITIEEYEAIRKPIRRDKDALMKTEEQKLRILKNAGFESDELCVVAPPVNVLGRKAINLKQTVPCTDTVDELFQDYQTSFIQEEKNSRRQRLHPRGLWHRLFHRRKFTI